MTTKTNRGTRRTRTEAKPQQEQRRESRCRSRHDASGRRENLTARQRQAPDSLHQIPWKKSKRTAQSTQRPRRHKHLAKRAAKKTGNKQHSKRGYSEPEIWLLIAKQESKKRTRCKTRKTGSKVACEINPRSHHRSERNKRRKTDYRKRTTKYRAPLESVNNREEAIKDYEATQVPLAHQIPVRREWRWIATEISINSKESKYKFHGRADCKSLLPHSPSTKNASK